VILWIGPNPWDREEMARRPERVAVVDHPAYLLPEAIGPSLLLRRFDVRAHIEGIVDSWRGRRVEGVVGTDEFLACAVAAVVARRLGLPGPDPAAVLLCQHKYHARRRQREIAPECVPDFSLVDPDADRPPLAGGFPIFVKPVRATCSVLARRIDSPAELRRFARRSFLERAIARRVLRPFHDLLAAHTAFEPRADRFLAEGLLRGSLAAVEGYVRRGRARVVGIVDSTMVPGTISFLRFDYPSRLPPEVQARMRGIAEALAPALGLDDSFFNVEMFHDPDTGRIDIVEVNPRMCYQFADLYEKVDGLNSYDVQLALATGAAPPTPPPEGGRFRAAVSYVLRTFDECVLERLPSAEQVAAVRARFPGARVRIYGRPGLRIGPSLQGFESFRTAILNLGGDGPDDLRRAIDEASRMLPFAFRGAGDAGRPLRLAPRVS
jgi:hypothetical protein